LNRAVAKKLLCRFAMAASTQGINLNRLLCHFSIPFAKYRSQSRL
jgi:hypothetical protein